MSLAETHRSTDPRPLRVRIPEALQGHPDGLTTRELAGVLGDAQVTISAVVSKMSCYGAGIEKCGPTFGKGTRWRLKTRTI